MLQKHQSRWKYPGMDDDMIRAFENSVMKKVLISEYKEKYRYTIYTKEAEII